MVAGKGMVGHVKRSNSVAKLTIRERRMWQNRLMTRQEAIDKAVEEMEDAILSAYEGGMPYSAIAGTLGLHQTSTREMALRADKRRSEGGSEGSE